MASQHPSTVSDSLAKIPDNIAVSFLSNGKTLSQKILQKGLNYFTQGYIHNVKVSEVNGTIRVDAKCWRSMRKSQAPHSLHIEIGEKHLSESFCSCKAGIAGNCSHIVGLLKTLQGFKLHNFTHVPDLQSCTSIPQTWHIPRGEKIKPVPVNHVIVAKPIENRKRRPVLCQIETDCVLPKMSNQDIDVLRKLKGTPLAYIASMNAPTVETPVGQVQLGSYLSYQTRNLKRAEEPVESAGCGDNCVFKPSPVALPQEFRELNLDYNNTDFCKLELATRQQNMSKEWFEARKSRLTASNFGRVLNRKSTPSDKFLKNLFSTRQITAPSLEYGKRHESEAKKAYMERNSNTHFHECGLVVNKDYAFLGATPDGKLCDNGQTGIVEVKCPFSARNMKILAACEEITDFCCENINGNIKLKTSHDYYAQIQGQLMITGCDFCEFILFTQCDLFVQRIKPDHSFMTELLMKLSQFFRDFAKPYLAGATNAA